jgi:acetyl esterase/lipase
MRRRCLPLAALVLAAAGCAPQGPAKAADAGAPAARAAPEGGVWAVRDLAYYEGPGADPAKHRLDLYLPADKTDFPAVLFVHGGAWVLGDRKDFGVYEALGRMFARHGIGAAAASYRLAPRVKHPEQVKDVARAFAWLHAHIGQYGGWPDRVFVAGHSAGGHLAALLATDETYLAAEGLSLKDVRGALPISAVYSLPDGLFNDVFGTDPTVRKAAGALAHAQPGRPPFLILYADKDFPFCDVGSEAFARALQQHKVPARTVVVKERNHIDVIAKAPRDDDPCGQALVEFIRGHAGP